MTIPSSPQESRQTSKKRTLDSNSKVNFKSETKNSSGDEPIKPKKVKYSNDSSRISSGLAAESRPKLQKTTRSGDQPVPLAGTRDIQPQKENDKTALLLKEFESNDEEGTTGEYLDIGSPLQLKDIPRIPEKWQIADGDKSKDSKKSNDTGVIYVG